MILAQEKTSHEKYVEESKMREGHLRTMNKVIPQRGIDLIIGIA